MIDALVLVLALDRPLPAESPAPEPPPDPPAVSPEAPREAPTTTVPAKRPRAVRFGAVAGATVGTFFGIPNTRGRFGAAMLARRDLIGVRVEVDWEPGSTEYGLEMHRIVVGVGAETVGRIRLGLGVHLPYTFVLRTTEASSFMQALSGDIGGFGLGGHASLWVDVIRLDPVTFMLGARGDLETYFRRRSMSSNDFEQWMLRSAERDEGPSAERRRRNRAAVMSATGIAASASIAATSAKTALAAAPAAKSAAAGAMFTKAGALAALGLACAGAVVAVHSRGEAPVVAPAAPTFTPPTSAASTVARSSADSVAAPPSEIATEPASVPSAAAPKAVKARTTRTARPTLDPLAVEAALLEAARVCVEAGDASCATSKLDEHRTRFPHGELVREASLLRSRVNDL